MPSHKLSAVYPCVSKLGNFISLSPPVVRLIAGSAPYLESRPIPRSDSLCSAFSSISVQRVRDSAVLPEHDDRFWSVQSQNDAMMIVEQKNRHYPDTEKLREAYQKGGEPREKGERGKEARRDDAEITTESK